MGDKCCSTSELETSNLHEDEHNHHHENSNNLFKLFLPAIFSFLLLAAGMVADQLHVTWFSDWLRIIWYSIAYIPVGFPVIAEAWKSILQKDFFSEFFLMTIATVGAFAIGEYPEAVAVMLFYTVGENFQSLAVTKAKNNIKSLLDQRPDEVTIIENNIPQMIKAQEAQIGNIIQLKPGEKLALDGALISERSFFNTAALTGESQPDAKIKGEKVLAGMVNLNSVSLVQVTNLYEDSKLSKILALVQDATARKAPTELFIRKFSKIYTPIVVLLAFAICFLPYFWVDDYLFKEWLYRALIFLVISCPCALVISIPLGYFGGIGAASRNGILFKGGNYLDKLATVQNVVMDKTGTLTEGVFKVQEIHFDPAFDQNHILQMVNALEALSSHPLATAILEYVGPIDNNIILKNAEEIAGHGLKAEVDNQLLLVGNFRLMDKFNIQYDVNPAEIVYTTIAVAYNNSFVGYLTIADQIKENAQSAIDSLHQMKLKTTMLSGDKNNVVQLVAQQLGIDAAYGDLLPEDKVNIVSEIKANKEVVVFVGDGLNDAPVIALSDVGMAMGGLGSDATIETADIVIQDDNPAKIATAINISKQTKKIVWQNVGLAFGVKALVLILGASGNATIWEAVFADVGVALLAILNAIRIQRMKFK